MAGSPRLLLSVALLGTVVVGGALAVGDTLLQKRADRAKAVAMVGGNPDRGAALMVRYGCSACHRAPGVWPGGQVGPPLDDLSERVYLAGALLNTPENLVAWILEPQALVPHSAMPNTGISEPEARDVAAYLYSVN